MPRKTKMNDLTSPELIEQINPVNRDLLSDFLEYLKSVQRSDTTIEAYRGDINIAFVWNLQNNNNIPYTEWTKRNIVKYQNWLLNENGNSPARVRRLRASLSSLGNYIESVLDDEYPNYRNIINKIEAPVNQPVREKTVLSEEDVEYMLKSLVDEGKYQMACFVALAAYGGRRKSELCRFRVSDFADDKLVCGGSLWKSDPIKTKGRGNGKFLNCYTLVKPFKPYLDLWMKYRSEKGVDSPWLFPSEVYKDRPISKSLADSWALYISKKFGKDFYFHALRHFYSTMLSNHGLPDNVIKEIQGWSDISMVAVYLDRTTEDTLDMYFDENGIKMVEKKDLSSL